MPEKVTEADALADIRRVAAQVGHPPTTTEYRTHGEYSIPTVAKHHDGSFTAARAAALDVADADQAAHRRAELVADLQRVADAVGGEPSKGDYEERGEFALSTITYRFESWVAAKQEAGVYEGLDEGPTREEVLADMQRVDERLDAPLSQKRYDEHGDWTSMTAKRRFESWEVACQRADVSRPTRGPQTADTSEFIADIQRVAEELGHVPSRSEYHEHGRFTRQMAKNRVGSWPEAVEEAGLDALEAGGPPGEHNGHWADIEPYYGPDWSERAAEVRERDGHECLACGMTAAEHREQYGSALNVHHIEKAREFDNYEAANALDNLVTLCNSCHKRYEHLPNERAKELVN